MAAEAAVSIAVKTLGNLLIEKALFLKGVKAEVEWVRDELKRMQCFLNDAARKQSENGSIRNWISEIRSLAHDAEDAIEIFVLNVQSRARFTHFPKHLYHLNKVGKQIESIRIRLAAVEDSRKRYGIRDLQRSESSSSRSELEEVEFGRRLNYWQNDKHVVGMKRDVELLLEKSVFDKSEGLSVAAILGMGGIGKSTLAGKIYNHADVVSRFEHRVWVVVSSEFTAGDVMKQILLQLGISFDDLKLLECVENRLGRGENMKREIHKRLTGKRYFIVLDDVWEAAHWESLTSAFPDEDKCSRLMLTSRNQVITMHSGYVHNMKVLDADESRELFWRKAFNGKPNDDKCIEEVKDVGEEILRKCGGLPLAISVVGSLLSKKTRSRSEWEKVVAEMKHHIHMDTSRDISTISAILELSYQNLSPELKACFLCLGFYEEDAAIEAKNLVRIWVAQGLVRQEAVREGEMKEDVARAYLNELISRNMVQVEEIEYDQVRGCRVHDLVRDLSIRKAKEDIDFDVLREEEDKCYSHRHDQSLDKPRHRAIYCNRLKFIYSTNRNRYLRSLFIHVNITTDIDIFVTKASYWKNFELLRVLDLGLAVFLRFPSAIGELSGLRYLRMEHRECYKSKLPRSWGKLRNLEVLDLYGGVDDEFVIIDRVITKMVSLRHLYSHILVIRSKAVRLGGMRKLESLSMIRVKDADLLQIQLGGMSSVSELGFEMSEMSNPDKLVAYLATLEKLECLTFRGYMGPVKLCELHRITRLTLVNCVPRNFPPNLTYLTLNKVRLQVQRVRVLTKVLERMPKLLYLKLRKLYNATELVVSSRGFPSLRVLHLELLDAIKCINVAEDAMAGIEQVIVRKCKCLDTGNLPEHVMSAMADAH